MVDDRGGECGGGGGSECGGGGGSGSGGGGGECGSLSHPKEHVAPATFVV